MICDASDFAISSVLMLVDEDGRERVVSNQSRQVKHAEQYYPIHDMDLLAMWYTLVKFRVYLLVEESFVVYTGNTSLRTTTMPLHLCHCMARWSSCFAE